MGRDGRAGRAGECIRQIEYSALPSQARFHRSTARFKGFSGPIGSGKSQALCIEAIKLAYLYAGRLGLLVAPTYPLLRDATQTTLFDILEKNGIPYEHSKGENTVVLTDVRSRILFRPVEEFDRLRGMNLAWFGLDELTYTQEDAWVVLEGRLRDPKAKRLCGFATWTPKGFDWVYRRFMLEPVDGYETVIAEPFENRHLLKRIPDFYERLKRSYDAKFQAKVPAREPKYLVVDANTYSQQRQIPRFSEYQNAGDAGMRAIVDGTIGKIKDFFVLRSQFVAKTGSPTVTTHNLAFARSAVGLVVRQLPQPLPGTGAIAEYAELGNFGMRVTLSYQPNTLAQQFTVDVLYGVGVLRNSFGVQVNS